MKNAKEILEHYREQVKYSSNPFDYDEKIIEAMEAYADQQKPKWISASEPPEKPIIVVVFIEPGVVTTGWYDNLGKKWRHGSIGEVTHWQPLPSPPTK